MAVFAILLATTSAYAHETLVCGRLIYPASGLESAPTVTPGTTLVSLGKRIYFYTTLLSKKLDVKQLMMKTHYVRCVENRQFIHFQGESLPDEEICGLIIGKMDKHIVDKQAEKRGVIRVIDESFGEPGSEEGYCTPPITLNHWTLPTIHWRRLRSTCRFMSKMFFTPKPLPPIYQLVRFCANCLMSI